MKDQYKGTIKYIKEIFDMGYVPSRNLTPYTKIFNANCFEHACFNLTNKQLNSSLVDECAFCCFYDQFNFSKTEDNILNFISETGLNISKSNNCSETLLKNQWKVALFFSTDQDFEYLKDFHFFLQIKKTNGKTIWTSKRGFLDPDIYINKKLKNEYFIKPYTYDFRSMYVITNPNAPEK